MRGGEGAEVIYALRNTSDLPDLILDKLEDKGQIIRKAYQRRLPSDTSKDYYFMQRNTGDVQSLTVEYGFLDNDNDAAKLKNNWPSYADAVVDAVVEYIGLGPSQTTYTVQSGDSLWNIAKKFNISVEELKLANNLTSNLLRVGQVLKIPTQDQPESGNYTVYNVKAGDSLYSIAQKYNTTVNELIDYNSLSTTNLKINQQILIPKKEEVLEENVYVVQSGDTLYSIAQQYGVTINDIMELNNLTTSVLNIGQQLKIPSYETPDSGINYVVKKGDNLYSIAQKYNTTVNEIKSLNNLTSNLLSVGQTLKIPQTSGTLTYTVQSGDNLYAIARRYNTTVDEIKKKNNLVSNNLSIGQILVI